MKRLLSKFTLLFSVLLIVASCSNDDDTSSVFGENPTERQLQQQEELSELLQSSPEGWKMTYFTDDPRYTDTDQQLGGWTFVMKFTDDEHVTMVSDFTAETLSPKESLYDIIPGSTTKLSFSTATWISLLSDSANYPTAALTAYGYKGDNEFLYYGQEGDDLIFRSDRDQIEIRFTKATAEDFTNLDQARETGNLLANSGNFQVEISEDGNITTYDNFSFNPSTRFVTNTEVDSLSFGVAYKPNGLKVVKPIQVGSEEATDFTYDATNNWFISELSNGNYVKILLGDPILVSDIVSDYYFAVLGVSGGPIETDSEGFVEIFNTVYEDVQNEKSLDLYGFFVAPQFGFVQYVFFDENDDPVYVNHAVSNYSVDDGAGTLTLEDGGYQDSSYEDLLQPFDDLLFDADGLKVISTGSFYQGDPVFKLNPVSTNEVIIGSYGIEN